MSLRPVLPAQPRVHQAHTPLHDVLRIGEQYATIGALSNDQVEALMMRRNLAQARRFVHFIVNEEPNQNIVNGDVARLTKEIEILKRDLAECKASESKHVKEPESILPLDTQKGKALEEVAQAYIDSIQKDTEYKQFYGGGSARWEGRNPALDDDQRDFYKAQGLSYVEMASRVDTQRMVLDVSTTLRQIYNLEKYITQVKFPIIDGTDGQKYYPGFCPAYEGPANGIKWFVNDKYLVSENTVRGNVIDIKFYIPTEQYTELTESTTIKCSSFVLRCTISAGTLNLEESFINIATKDVPEIELHWEFTDVKESDPASVTCKPGPTNAELEAA
jgi:hypothetical protein